MGPQFQVRKFIRFRANTFEIDIDTTNLGFEVLKTTNVLILNKDGLFIFKVTNQTIHTS